MDVDEFRHVEGVHEDGTLFEGVCRAGQTSAVLREASHQNARSCRVTDFEGNLVGRIATVR